MVCFQLRGGCPELVANWTRWEILLLVIPKYKAVKDVEDEQSNNIIGNGSVRKIHFSGM